MALLEVENLQTHFRTPDGVNRAVDGVSFAVERGETVAIVGESGCGKSVTANSILRLVPQPPGKIAGQIRVAGVDLLKLSERAMRNIRGNRISMVFQEPMTSLNPVLTVGGQIAETLRLHQRLGRTAVAERAVEMLNLVGIAEPRRRGSAMPTRFSISTARSATAVRPRRWCSRSVSAIWPPTVSTGLRLVIGSWNTMLIRLPRMLRMARSESLRRSTPSKRI